MSGKDHIQREDIMGLGKHSLKKTYYSELLKKIRDLEEANHNLQSIFDHTNDAIIIHDCNGKLFKTNQIADKLFEISEQDSEPNFLHFIQSKNSDIDFKKSWQKVLTDAPITIECPCTQVKSQKDIYIQISMSKTQLNGQDLIISLIRDFKQRMLYEKELRKAKEKAEENDQLKSAFLANISHEIRTPLNGIMGFTQLLDDPEFSEDEKKSFIGIIEKSGQKMLSTVNDIIDISKIESGQVDLILKEMNLEELLDFQVQFFKPEANSKGLSLNLIKSISSSQKYSIISDKEKLTAIISNLIKNAIKYTKEGFIEVKYGFSDEAFSITIKDSGIGIPKDKQESIFDRFMQVSTSEIDNREGSGIGLSIVKAYTDLLGGTISLDSEIGKGSRFILTFPIHQQSDLNE